MTKPISTPVPWPHPRADLESARRDDLVQLGVWMFLGTVVMLFAAFTSAYIIRRGASDWTPIALPWILWANTAVLVASSLAIERGRRAMGSEDGEASARRGVSAAAGLGLLFLAGQTSAWRQLVDRGVYLPTSPHSSFFFVLTGTHAVHVAAGLLLVICAAARMARVGGRTDRAAPRRLVTAAATFWHFLAALWLYVMALVTVF